MSERPTLATPAEVEQILAELPDEISNAGRELCLRLAPAIAGRYEATRPGTQRICTAIAWHARKYHRAACLSYEVDADGYEAAERAREVECADARRALVRLVAALPAWIDEPDRSTYDSEACDVGEIERAALLRPWSLDFNGDVRGAVVKLTGARFVYDSFGGDGVIIPGAVAGA